MVPLPGVAFGIILLLIDGYLFCILGFLKFSGTYSSHLVNIISACALPISACLAVVGLLLRALVVVYPVV